MFPENSSVKHRLNPSWEGRVVPSASGRFSEMIRVAWSNGEVLHHRPEFIVNQFYDFHAPAVTVDAIDDQEDAAGVHELLAEPQEESEDISEEVYESE